MQSWKDHFLSVTVLGTNELDSPVRIDSLLDTNADRSPQRGNYGSLLRLSFYLLKLIDDELRSIDKKISNLGKNIQKISNVIRQIASKTNLDVRNDDLPLIS